ncbi:MAG: hypothetical protein K2X47_19285 [Bdellovibrionales bacterium]|nr:hypothetical protein [Bdellovibrionales bacterium]
MKLINRLVLSAFLTALPSIAPAGLQNLSCSVLSLNPLSVVQSVPSFFSDRTILEIPLTEDPSPYFGEVPMLARTAGGPFPPMAFRLARRLSEVVWLSPDVDIRKLFEVGRLYTFVLMKDRLVLGRVPTSGEEVFSKHLVLANHYAVLFSGDIRITQAGVLEFSNASGSYLPPKERLYGFARFLEDRFGITPLAAFSMDATQTYHHVSLEMQTRSATAERKFNLKKF